MSTTLRDASLTTLRRKQITLYVKQIDDKANSVLRVGGTDMMTNLDAHQGAALVGQTAGASCPCTNVSSTQGYDKKSPAC